MNAVHSPARTVHGTSTGRLPQRLQAVHFRGSVLHGVGNTVCKGQGTTHARTV